MKKVVIAGGSGYLGRLLATYYRKAGVEVVILTRWRHETDQSGLRYVEWDGEYLEKWVNELEEADALINLAGKSVNCRYNEKNKQLICDSRINPTRTLGEAVEICEEPPRVWINASSATIYRHANDRPMDEEKGEIGTGFSVDVCRKWEKAFTRVKLPLTRKIVLRTGMVLGGEGGAFVPLVRLARLGLGGKVGSGRQHFSWIHEEDFVRIIDFLIRGEELKGTYNACAPEAVTNEELMQLVRKAYHIPFGMPLPKILLEIGAFLIGTETELLLKSRWVIPTRLLRAGFQFKYPQLKAAVEAIAAQQEKAAKAHEKSGVLHFE